ncbi:MAG: hypothetical protein MUD14_13445 [Hydrococcus sp. Prado102]|jgi:hypothetical protein|nr:hypothetical protein [Hydrococcus sp. Prado102]
MLLKQTHSKRKQLLLKLTLPIYLIFACDRALGATLFTRLDNLVTNVITSDFQFEIEAFLEQEKQNWEEIAEKILVSKTNTASSLGLLVANSVGDRTQSYAEKAPLSIRSVVETFKQLNLETDRKNAKASNVPRLPQVAYRDIDKGVYVFEPTSTVKEQSGNAIVFDQDNFVSAGSFGQVRSIGISGFSIATPNPIAAVGTSSASQPSSGMGITPVHLSAPILNAQLSLLPQNQISSFIGSANASINNVLNTLNSFGGLKVERGFRLLPTISVPSQLDLQDDFVQKSNLVRGNVALISPLQTQIQKQVKLDAQKSYGQQQDFQRSMYEQAASRQQQYQKMQKESLKKFKEQQQRQIERQQERQEKLKERFQKQLDKNLKKYKERHRKLR